VQCYQLPNHHIVEARCASAEMVRIPDRERSITDSVERLDHADRANEDRFICTANFYAHVLQPGKAMEDIVIMMGYQLVPQIEDVIVKGDIETRELLQALSSAGGFKAERARVVDHRSAMKRPFHIPIERIPVAKQAIDHSTGLGNAIVGSKILACLPSALAKPVRGTLRQSGHDGHLLHSLSVGDDRQYPARSGQGY
jgi:hypothetical protein